MSRHELSGKFGKIGMNGTYSKMVVANSGKPLMEDSSAVLTWEQTVDASYAPNTLAQMKSSLNQHQLALGPKLGTLDFKGLMNHLTWSDCLLSNGSAQILCNAVTWWQQRTFKYVFSEHEKTQIRIAQQALAARRKAKPESDEVCEDDEEVPHEDQATGAKKRGSITYPMLLQLLDEADEKRRAAPKTQRNRWTTIRRDLAFCWLTGLRGCQMATVRYSDIRRDGDDGFVIVTPKVHSPTHHDKVNPQMTKISVINDMDLWKRHPNKLSVPIYTGFCNDVIKAQSGLLSPDWNSNLKMMRDLIKATSVKYGWSDLGVSIVGPHSLRHGAIGAVKEARGLSQAAAFAGHTIKVRPLVTERYADSNEVKAGRVKPVGRQEERVEATVEVREVARGKRSSSVKKKSNSELEKEEAQLLKILKLMKK
jgi:integrase